MTALAGLVDSGSEDVLDAYRAWVAALPIQPSVRSDRLWRATRFLTTHPDLTAWMERPTRTRLADLHRTKAWPFATWLFVTGRVCPDLELVAAKPCGVDLPAV